MFANRTTLFINVSKIGLASTITSHGIGGVFSLVGAIRCATKKSGGSTRNGRDSNPKYLGLKKTAGEMVIPGNILIRQRGTKFHPGKNVGIGKDHTIFSLATGLVHFHTVAGSERKYVSVINDPKEIPDKYTIKPHVIPFFNEVQKQELIDQEEREKVKKARKERKAARKVHYSSSSN
eukprot:TRINITY_DN7164_c0_g1_i1.p1 TRINITY_DN7164_c0_g1~~TRINITY_DN7164_c0_g1_i1.p1  ORF type:complete len:191 (-),score=37.62 TRINITY_DN7164_c0_g1_i1:67-600(-)